MIRRLRIPLLIGLVALLSVAASAPAASAASCTGTPHDADAPVNDNFNQFDVSCDTAIVNGGFTIGTNRGVEGHPDAVISNGTGALSCNAEAQAPGAEFTSVIACTGSVSAGATAGVFTSLGPNPCGSPPPFAGSFSVNFGDGTSFGPAALAAYPCDGNDGGPGCEQVKSGKDCDPGGVFQDVITEPPSKASVTKAKHGLKFQMKFGVEGKAVVTIEVEGKVLGKTSTSVANKKVADLVAKLSRKGARAVADEPTKALIHVEVQPDSSEGLSSGGRQYFRLKLTG